MGFARRTMRFGSGLVLGAAVGSALSLLLAPRSGEEAKAEIADRIEAAKRAKEEAELLEEERLKRAFRAAVNDPTALTGKFEGQRVASLKSPDDAYVKAQEKARKEEQEAEEARKKAQKAEDQLRKAREQAEGQIRKAEEQARQARERSAKEDTEAAQARNLANTPPERRN
jgi:gas vesicle protein